MSGVSTILGAGDDNWLYTYDIPLTVTAFEAGLRRL